MANNIKAREQKYKEENRHGKLNEVLPKQLKGSFIDNKKESLNFYLFKAF